MPYLISDWKTDLEGMLHSTGISKLKNPYHVAWRAARKVLALIDPKETIRIVQIPNAIHDEIYDYTIASDTKGNKIIDIRPQANRDKSDSFSQRLSKEFDKYKKAGTFQIRTNKGVKTLRLAADIEGSPVTVHSMDSLTENGIWSIGGDATNLILDTLEYLYGSASLNFDLNTLGSVGYIENSDFDAVDLSDYDEIGAVFVSVYIPNPSIITNFILRWGSSNVNYWTQTVTAPHDQSTFKTGWQILRFDWNGATESIAGGVDPSAIDYLRLSVTYNGTAETDLRVDKITCSKGEIYEQEYYSECLFQNSVGDWISKPTSDEDQINLDEDGYNIFLYESMIEACQQMAGEDARADLLYAKEQLYGDGSRENMGLYHKYRVDHPSEALRPRQYYYRLR